VKVAVAENAENDAHLYVLVPFERAHARVRFAPFAPFAFLLNISTCARRFSACSLVRSSAERFFPASLRTWWPRFVLTITLPSVAPQLRAQKVALAILVREHRAVERDEVEDRVVHGRRLQVRPERRRDLLGRQHALSASIAARFAWRTARTSSAAVRGATSA